MPRHVLPLLLLTLLASACSKPDTTDSPLDASPDAETLDLGAPDASRDLATAEDAPSDLDPTLDLGPIPEDPRSHEVAHGCYTLSARAFGTTQERLLSKSADGTRFTFEANATPSLLRLHPADLATYLLYDEERRYVVVKGQHEHLQREETLLSDVLLIEDHYLPGAQWVLQGSIRGEGALQLQHLESGQFLTATGALSPRLQDAALLTLTPAQGCAEHPELSLDASGAPSRTTFEDGTLYGIVDTHSHILSNFGFGGGGIYHGAPFHPLGVQHALPSCEPFHGEEGRKDLFGYGADHEDFDQQALLTGLVTGRTPEFNHHTAGYPDFTDWPNAPTSSTHQTQYYRWLERAWLGGLRLMVQHATTNRVICDLIIGNKVQRARYSCNDMVAVDRIIDETYHMERYIDAQSGGPGKGWFRVVTTPAQAREVIAQGKLAIVLGIETSHLFDCFITPPEGEARCTEQEVVERLDRYYERGVRVLFPVHKYDNGFSAGDGDKDLIEVGNFAQSGHWSNFTEDCPQIPTVFDRGALGISGLNMPRDDYFAPPPNDMSKFPTQPVRTLLSYVDYLTAGPLAGDFCQNAGLTPLGEFLVLELMRRGMVIELDHLPRRSYQTVFAMLEQHDYPGVGSHGNNNDGKLYQLGGVSKGHLERCGDPATPKSRIARMQRRVALIDQAGYLPAEGFGFDLNGFAGGTRGRFSPDAPCPIPQEDPVTYPFTSLDGSVTFTSPQLANRQVDYNAEGFVHIGMLPELIEDARHDGATEEDLAPLFKSAEAYIRMWERSEAQAIP